MADGELSSDAGDQIPEIRAMADERQQRAVLLVDGLPVGAVHLGVVEVLALNAPRLSKDLRPLGARVDPCREGGDVERPVADTRGPVERHDAPAIPVGAIQQLLRVAREAVRADTFQERRRTPLAQLVAVEIQRRAGTAAPRRLEIEDGARRSRFERAVIARRHVECQDALTDAIDVDAYRNRPGGFLLGLGGGARLVACLGQQRRRLAGAQDHDVDRARRRPINRAHLEPAGSQRVVRAREEVQIFPACVERRRGRVGEPVGHLKPTALGEGIQKDRAQMAVETLGIRNPS